MKTLQSVTKRYSNGSNGMKLTAEEKRMVFSAKLEGKRVGRLKLKHAFWTNKSLSRHDGKIAIIRGKHGDNSTRVFASGRMFVVWNDEVEEL